MTIVVVAGNPQPASHHLDAGARLAAALAGREPDHVVDVVTRGAGLLGWGDEQIALAPALLLEPVLVELGATTPAPGLYLHDSTYTTDSRIADYAERRSPVPSAALRNEAAS